MAEESELVGGISVSLGATHERLAGDIAAANAIVEEQWSNKVFTAKLRVESASGAGQIGPAAAPGAAQAGPIVVQARTIEETGAQTAQARSALAIPTQQTTPGMTEGERVVEGLGGVEDATSGVAKSVQELAELQGRGTEAPTPAVVAQQRVERTQAAVGETQPTAGFDVEAARTNALLASHEAVGSSLAAAVNEIVGRLSALSAGLGAFAERLALAGAGPVGTAPRSQTAAVEQVAASRPAPVPPAREAIASVELQAQTVSVEPPTTPAAQAATPSIGVPVTASSMQMRDAEQAAAVRARRETQNEARVAATAVQDRGIPDTSQEWLEERYTRPLAAQAAVEAVPAVAPRVQTGAVERATVAREPQRVVRQAVDTVEIAAQSVAMPAAQVEAQAASIEAPRAAVTAERPESVAATSGRPTQLSLFEGQPGPRPASQTGLGAQLQMFPEPRPTTEPGRGARLAAAAEADENENRLANSVRFAGRAKAEEERADARIQSARVRAAKQAYSESESQRREELASTGSFYDKVALITEKHFTGEEVRAAKAEPQLQRADDQERLGNLTYEAQRESAKAPTSRTFAPQATPAQIAARREEAARLVDAAPAPPPTFAQRRQLTQQQAVRDERQRQAGIAAGVIPTIDTGARAEEARIANVEALKASARVRVQAFDEAAQERVVQSRRAAVTASGRTGRTAAFGIGTLFGGTQGRQIEAQAEASQAARQLRSAERAIQPLDDRLRDVAKAWQSSTGEARKFQREQFLGIRTSSQYKEALVGVKNALDADAAAQAKLTGLQGFRSITQNLLAGAAGGAAFGVALAAMSEGARLVGQAVGPTLERLTGFAATTASYTDNLADATRAASGNAQAVTALKLASTGLSAATASSIQPLIQQRAEIEAGNKAIQEQIEAFNVSENLRTQGAGAGITSGTGGIQGSGILGVPGVNEQMGNFFQQRGDAAQAVGASFQPDFRGLMGLLTPQQQTQAEQVEAQALFARGLNFVNEQMEKGGETSARFAQDLSKLDPRIEKTAQAFQDIGAPKIAEQARALGLFVDSIAAIEDPIKRADAALRASVAFNVGGQLPSAELLQQQFNRQNPALINAAARQQQFAANVQLPAQQALQNLVTPLKPVGTGFAAANAEEQRRVADTQKESIQLQDQLNKRYEQGVEILENTYKVPPQLLNQIKAVGQQIAGIQASISNEQAAYQTAQYNYQLFIAKRTLADIGGLTGKNFGAGQSYLGQLEKENLALSRQGQQLQFNLSQRSINFQRAVAGFTAPGLTPEERAARIEQANIEADIAQKQLDIGKGIFQNQVKIVDIQNLRAGADLVKQIALLEQGRAVTIDVQVKTEELERLILLQQQQVAEAGTYIAQVESLVQAAFGQIQQLEVAAGSAVAGIANKVLEQFGLTLNGINTELEEFANDMNSRQEEDRERNRINQVTEEPEEAPRREGQTPQGQYAPRPDQRDNRHGASGMLGRTSGSTDITIGEAGAEEVAVLRNPRAYLGGGGGGGQNVSVVFTGEITVRGEDDLRKMEQFVESAVVRALGRGSSLQGLRLS